MKNKLNASGFLSFLNKQKALAAFVVLFVFLSIFTDSFFKVGNLISLLSQSSAYMIIAMGVTVCVIGSSPDLSVGGMMCLSGIITIGLQPYMPTVVAALVAILVGAIVGFVNGFLVVHQKTEAWVITLGMGMFLKGLNLLILDGQSIYGIDDGYALFGTGSIAGIPYIVLVAGAMVVLFHLMMKRTSFGRNIYAFGGNYDVAVYSGIDAKKQKWFTFVISGMMAALGGIVYSARMNTASAIFGERTALIVNCCVVIGGTSFAGGVGGIWQSAVGILLLNLIENGMNMMGIDSYVQQLTEGIIIVAITALDLLAIKRKREKV